MGWGHYLKFLPYSIRCVGLLQMQKSVSKMCTQDYSRRNPQASPTYTRIKNPARFGFQTLITQKGTSYQSHTARFLDLLCRKIRREKNNTTRIYTQLAVPDLHQILPAEETVCPRAEMIVIFNLRRIQHRFKTLFSDWRLGRLLCFVFPSIFRLYPLLSRCSSSLFTVQIFAFR